MDYDLYISTVALAKAIDGCFESLVSSPPTEKGGFLIGFRNDMNKITSIQDSCDAPFAFSAPTYMKITHDDWEFADRYLKKMHSESANLNILGWYHSHPGYGVYMSGRDQFIINSFFNKPWNVSLVVDPTKRAFAFFRLHENEVQPLLKFHLSCGQKRDDNSEMISIHIIDRRWKYLGELSLDYNGQLDKNKPLAYQLKCLLILRGPTGSVFIRRDNRKHVERLSIDLSPSELHMCEGNSLIID